MQTTTNKGKSYLLKLYSQRIVGYWVKWCLHCYLISVYCQCSIKIHSYTHTSIPFQYIATVQTLITRYFAPYPVSLSQTLQTTMNPGQSVKQIVLCTVGDDSYCHFVIFTQLASCLVCSAEYKPTSQQGEVPSHKPIYS